MKNRFTLLAAGIPLLMLILSLTAFIINTRIAEGKPVIAELVPEILSPGESLSIKGRNFGDEKDSSKVYISTLDLLSKNILSWSDREIKITLPVKVSSGLLTVETDRGKSRPAVLVIREDIPFIGSGAYIPGLPYIESIDPSTGSSGDVITIKGDNFGSVKLNSVILFSSVLSREKDTPSGDTVLSDFMNVDDESILLWSNGEISFYLPDFVSTGDVYIRTEKGLSNAAYFEQKLQKSTLTLSDGKTYMFSESATASVGFQANGSRLNIWMLSPMENLFQRNVVILPDRNNPGSLICSSAVLYRLEDMDTALPVTIRQNTIVDIYNRSFFVDPSELPDKYDRKSPMYIKYTQASDLIPSASSSISSAAKTALKRITGSYNQAKALYEYVINRLDYSAEILPSDPETVMERKTGDSKAYALLFSAMARSQGIPARPVTGLFLDIDNNPVPHWWAEFYIQGFGWFPLDPSLGDGMPGAPEREKPVEYYWGNIDNQHIAYSRGEREIPMLFPDGVAINNTDHAFATHNVETGSANMDLRLDWSGVKMTAIY